MYTTRTQGVLDTYITLTDVAVSLYSYHLTRNALLIVMSSEALASPLARHDAARQIGIAKPGAAAKL
jgi:hypothetical protein